MAGAARSSGYPARRNCFRLTISENMTSSGPCDYCHSACRAVRRTDSYTGVEVIEQILL